MSYTDKSFGGLVNKSSGAPSQNQNTSGASLSIMGIVQDIILDENHPLYNTSQGFSQFGTIFLKEENSTGVLKGNEIIATPSNPNVKIFPVIGERVRCHKIAATAAPRGMWVYDPPISMWGASSPHLNQSPNPTANLTPSSQQMSYEDISNLGVFNIEDTEEEEISIIESPNPSQNTFIEKGNIHPLMYYSGDILYEGRWGQSIRFGSTTKSKSRIQNNYSSTGDNGNPIMIIRNGQSRLASSFGAEPIVEDAKNDLSSIYLTSYQTLPFSPTSGDFTNGLKSYSNQPILPSSYNKPQILLNSDRIIIDAEEDSILLSAQKSVGLLSNESVNLESKNISMHADTEIKIGSNNLEPVLLGDKTHDILKFILVALRQVCKTTVVRQKWPTGVAIPDSLDQTVSGNIVEAIEKIIGSLEIKEDPGSILSNIKSTKVKVE